MPVLDCQSPAPRELARRRLALGASVRAVSLALGVSAITLQRWERSARPLDDTRRTDWERALATVARERRAQLERSGFTLADLPGDLRRTLALYTDRAVA